MADVSQVETSFSFEPRTAPVNPTGPNRPQGPGANDSSRSPEGAPAGRSDDAVSVALSNEAQRLPAAPAPDAAARGTQEPAAPDTTFETSAPDGIEGSDGTGGETNQVTSFESERTGNDTHSTTEAGRTLGQVIDTFA
jgi:hypothetical protein